MGCETDVKKSSYMRIRRTIPTAARLLPREIRGFSCANASEVLGGGRCGVARTSGREVSGGWRF